MRIAKKPVTNGCNRDNFNVFVLFLTPALIPPPNFGYVEPELYRCAIPGELNFSFLQTLHLKTAVYLSLDPPAQILAEFLKEQGIELRQMVGGENTNVGQRISEKLVLDALHVLLDPDAYPLVVMCNLGRHRTGTVIGCLRRLQKWSLSSIFDEFRRFTCSTSSQMHEQFIELFDTELVELPDEIERLPFKLYRHPSVRIEPVGISLGSIKGKNSSQPVRIQGKPKPA